MQMPPPERARRKRQGTGSAGFRTSGSKKNARAQITSPIAPAASSSRIRITSGQNCDCSAIMKTRPDASAAAMIRAQASRVGAIGFSSTTCLPAANDSMAAGSCRSCGSIRSTASKSPSASAADKEVNARPPVRSAIAAARAGSASTTAVTSISGAW